MIPAIRIRPLNPDDLTTTLRADQVICTLTDDGMVQIQTIGDDEWYHAIDYATEEALHAALGWAPAAAPAPLAPETVAMLDVVRRWWHADGWWLVGGMLAFKAAATAWMSAGYPDSGPVRP